MTRNTSNILRSILNGFTGAGLFRKLDYPGAPNEFVDSRSIEEIRASGEFDGTANFYRQAKRSEFDDDRSGFDAEPSESTARSAVRR